MNPLPTILAAAQAGNPSQLTLPQSLLPVLGGVLLFNIITFACSLNAGWFALGRRYRAMHRVAGPSFFFESVAFGGAGRIPVSYRNCVFIRLAAQGIRLSVFPLFRLGTPPLLIPWEAIAACETEKFWFFRTTIIHVAEPRTRLRFYGQPAKLILAIWNKRQSQFPK